MNATSIAPPPGAQLDALAPRRIGRVRASAVFLEELLHLPPGHFITSAP